MVHSQTTAAAAAGQQQQQRGCSSGVTYRTPASTAASDSLPLAACSCCAVALLLACTMLVARVMLHNAFHLYCVYCALDLATAVLVSQGWALLMRVGQVAKFVTA
jgi:hypothetical protein